MTDLKGSILIVDDETDMRQTLESILKSEGFKVQSAEKASEAFELIRAHEPDLVILDQILKDMNGLDFLKTLKQQGSETTVIMISGYGDVKEAVQGMKMGAFEYLKKPFTKEEIVASVQRALHLRQLTRESEILRQTLVQKSAQSVPLFAESPAMKQVIEQVKKIAPTNLTVVLQGQSGTGKEVMARHIHHLSLRKDRALVTVDCGTLPESLVESELFGYEKGAFTGADQRKLGHFEMADEGTIFLDEIGNIPLATQAKLLRVIQEKKVQHLGGRKEIPIDVRVIVATNVLLEDAVRQGKFREDLYHRLNEFDLWLPPLRERKEDIPFLAHYFLEEANREFNKKVQRFGSAALGVLELQPWNGNIREFRNTVKRAVLSAEGNTIYVEDLLKIFSGKPKESGPQEPSFTPSAQPRIPENLDNFNLNREVDRMIHEYETQAILKALEMAGKNKTRAAKLLGITREDLYYKINKLALR